MRIPGVKSEDAAAWVVSVVGALWMVAVLFTGILWANM